MNTYIYILLYIYIYIITMQTMDYSTDIAKGCKRRGYHHEQIWIMYSYMAISILISPPSPKHDENDRNKWDIMGRFLAKTQDVPVIRVRKTVFPSNDKYLERKSMVVSKDFKLSVFLSCAMEGLRYPWDTRAGPAPAVGKFLIPPIWDSPMGTLAKHIHSRTCFCSS